MTQVLVLEPDGRPIDPVEVLAQTFETGARTVAIPLTRLPPGFLDLKTGLAGEILQKFVNYQRRVAIVGDVSSAVAASTALRDFVRESNRGRHIWFVDDLGALEARLSSRC